MDEDVTAALEGSDGAEIASRARLKLHLRRAEVPQLESNWRPRVSWSRTGGTGGTASAGVEPEAPPQLGSNRRPRLSWSRTGGPASAGVEPEAPPQLESNWRHRVSWSRTGGTGQIGLGCVGP